MSIRIGSRRFAWGSFRVEWKPQDAWIGAFWKRKNDYVDLWICLVPCVPIHFTFWTMKEGSHAP